MLTFAAGDPLSHVLDHSLESDMTLFWLHHPILDQIGLTKHVFMMLVATIICVFLFSRVSKGIARQIETGESKGTLSSMLESILVFLREEMVKPALGADTYRFLPLLWTYFFFIITCNLLGLIPFSATATGNISVTAGLAVIAFVTYHFFGMKRNGVVTYWKENLLVGPPFLWPLMIIIEVAGHVIKPAALAVRLFANMMGGHILLAVVMMGTTVVTLDNLLIGGGISLVSAISAVLLMFLELLVALIQAFIFTNLTSVFLGAALHPEH